MPKLKELVTEIQEAKKALHEMQEEVYTIAGNMERYNLISSTKYQKPFVNRVYRATRALNQYLHDETGVWGFDFGSLLQCSGYIGNPDEE